MKESIKKGLCTGFVFGIILIFLILIGFVNVGTDIIGSLLGNLENLTRDARLPVENLLIFFGIYGTLIGFSVQKQIRDKGWFNVMVAGLSAGLVAGLMILALIALAGEGYMQGVDFRTYLPNLSPTRMGYLLFYSTPSAAAQTYLIYLVLFSLLGSFISKTISIGDWLKRAFTGARESGRNLVGSAQMKVLFESQWFLVVLLIVVGILLYALPLVWGSYWNYIMGTVAIYILLGLGLNIIVGYSGQLVLGYVAFFATGAYTFALLTAPQPHAVGMNLWLAVGMSVLASTLTGLMLGLPILNLRGDYLAIVTLGFGEIVRILIRSDLLTPLTNGPRGVTNIAQPTWLGEVFSDVNFMHLLMLLVLVGLFVSKRLKDSRTGRAWIAIREDQMVAQATGINTFKFKILALLLGAAFAGLSGALFASRNQFTGPEDFTLMVSVNVLCIVIVGGMGSLPGVIAGAFVLKGLPELLRELSDYRLLAFGALLVVMMIVRPEGLWPVKGRGLSSSDRARFEQEAAEVEV